MHSSRIHIFISGQYDDFDPSLTDAVIAVQKDAEELKNKLNQALMQIKADGIYQEISAKYFPFMNY